MHTDDCYCVTVISGVTSGLSFGLFFACGCVVFAAAGVAAAVLAAVFAVRPTFVRLRTLRQARRERIRRAEAVAGSLSAAVPAPDEGALSTPASEGGLSAVSERAPEDSEFARQFEVGYRAIYRMLIERHR